MLTKYTIVPNPIRYDLKIYQKGKFERVNQYLGTHEIECSCEYSDCNRTLIMERTSNSFYLLRSVYGGPILINSAYRCQRHNADIGGVVNSYHMIGAALDIRPKDPEDLDDLIKLAEKFFDVVIPYKAKGFVHVHNIG